MPLRRGLLPLRKGCTYSPNLAQGSHSHPGGQVRQLWMHGHRGLTLQSADTSWWTSVVPQRQLVSHFAPSF